jgi:hypothetical protein
MLRRLLTVTVVRTRIQPTPWEPAVGEWVAEASAVDAARVSVSETALERDQDGDQAAAAAAASNLLD